MKCELIRADFKIIDCGYLSVNAPTQRHWLINSVEIFNNCWNQKILEHQGRLIEIQIPEKLKVKLSNLYLSLRIILSNQPSKDILFLTPTRSISPATTPSKSPTILYETRKKSQQPREGQQYKNKTPKFYKFVQSAEYINPSADIHRPGSPCCFKL